MTKSILLLLSIVTVAGAQYSLTLRNSGGANHAGEKNVFRADLVKDGVTIHTFERTLPFDVPFPATYVHPKNGTVVLSYIFDGFVEVYSGNGKKQWEQHFFKGMGPNYERTITVALGERSIAFNVSDVRMPHALAMQYALNGAKVWEAELPYMMGDEVAMSADERTVIAGSYFAREDEVLMATSLLNAKGAVTGSAEFLFKKAAFATDGKRIGLVSNVEAAVMDRMKGTLLARTGRKSDGVITDVTWNEGDLIVQEAKPVTGPDGFTWFEHPQFIRYSPALMEVRRTSVPAPMYRRSQLSSDANVITLTADGQRITVPVQ